MNIQYGCFIAIATIIGSVTSVVTRGQDALEQEEIVISSSAGERIKVVSGHVSVPESRTDQAGAATPANSITIPYYVLPSTSQKKGPAFFYLAGGPGSSGLSKITQNDLFKLVDFLRGFGDVVTFDQRGTGASQPNLQFRPTVRVNTDEKLTFDAIVETWKKQAAQCKQHLEEQGINLAAYNTDESASDIEDLRKALGYEKIILIGGSYGSHLGLHYLRKYPESVDRAIFSGIEGPDHTFDLPAEKLETVKRISKYLESTNAYDDRLPEGGFVGALEKVIDRLKEKPVDVELNRNGQKITVQLDHRFVQMIADRKAANRNAPEIWPKMILTMYEGEYSYPALGMVATSQMLGSINPMKYMMDCASGASDSRRARFSEDALAWKLFGVPNMDLEVLGHVWNAPELGDSFRANVQSDRPVLLVHGTWDTSTPIENAREVNSHLPNGHLIEVVRGSHGAVYDLMDHWPQFNEAVGSFIRGESAELPDRVEIPGLIFNSLDAKSDDPQIQLWAAARSGNLALMKEAISNGADVNALDTRKSGSGRRPLNYAALNNHENVIVYLVENGADVNASNKTGFTALHHACENGNVGAAKALIDAGAKTDLKTRAGKSPLDIAREFAGEQSAKKLAQLIDGDD